MIDVVKVCPECGIDMSTVDPVGHALSHYPEYLDPAKSGKLAIKRQAQILAGGVSRDVYLKEHKEEV